MKFLRTVSTRRLTALLAAVLVAIAGFAAIAIAATGGGPVPPPAPLASAIHEALGAKPVDGISAQISFTNNLISSSDVASSDPIITGATGRLWLSDGHLRLELQSDNGDAQIVVDHDSFWVYDPSANTVYEGTLPSASGSAGSASGSTGSGNGASGAAAGGGSGAGQGDSATVPTIDQINAELTKLAAHLDISSATPGDVGGQAAYRVSVSPKHDGGLLGEIQLAWDATHGVPLDFAVYAAGNSTPVLELQVTGISYGPVAAGVFNISPPAGATVVKVATPAGASSAGASSTGASNAGASSAGASGTGARGRTQRGARAAGSRAHAIAGTAAVAAALPFTLDAPASLDGLPQRSVHLLDWGSAPAALVLYGQGLGGVAVIEHEAHASAGASSSSSSGQSGDQGGDGSGLSLPTVSINGVTGQELDTALGTAIEFTRDGVSYLVLGSVPAVAAEAAARAL